MVTLHDLAGPRLVPVQVSMVLVNVEEPDIPIFSAEVVALPELRRVKAWFTVRRRSACRSRR